jgi:hypothetical protein
MRLRPINVTLLPDHQTVRAHQRENPLEVNPGDEVTWNFINATGQNLRVEFQAFMPTRDRSTPLISPGKHPFIGPFPPITATPAGTVTGIVADEADDGLYIYSIFNSAGEELKWETPAFAVKNYEAFFGTIVKPEGPPTG